jgi:hypothetical protein
MSITAYKFLAVLDVQDGNQKALEEIGGLAFALQFCMKGCIVIK